MDFQRPDGEYVKYSCKECLDGLDLGIPFSMAFQAIVNISEKNIYSFEALVRGENGESAGSILSRITSKNIYKFDQSIRVRAIDFATRLDMKTFLNINFYPNAVYRPETCIRTTIEACEEYGFPIDKIIMEVTEVEKVKDYTHLKNIFQEYKRIGLHTAIDDFGEGYSNLNLLAEFQPELLKVDMNLIRDIDKNRVKRVILKAIADVCEQLDIKLIAEGIETKEEKNVLEDMGIKYMQGYFFAKPVFENLSKVEDIKFS
ncbi:MAG: EAL domain-containing protein [Leptospiraceae bacterium]|nr:EAL domain-containing protein [Leptospiraceae bacterium]